MNFYYLFIIIIIIIVFYLINSNIIDKFSVESPLPDGEMIETSKSVKKENFQENWRDLPFIGNKDIVTYNNVNPLNYSRKNLPIYYPISSPLEDTYFNYLNSISSPKLSLFRSILRKVELQTNENKRPIVFNYAERPIEIKKVDKNTIKTLSKTVTDLINQFGKPIMKVSELKTLNEVHEETDQQSRIGFDIKLKLFYEDSENLGKSLKQKYDILFIQPEFIFEKTYNVLPEDQFFKKDKSLKQDFSAYLSKLIVIGSEHLGFLGGRYSNKKQKN